MLLHAQDEEPPTEAQAKAIASNILELDDFKLLYPSDYIYDHAVIYNPDDHKWHMYGIQMPHTSYIHLTSDSLTASPWEKKADFTYKGLSIWAPHIIKQDGKYWMYSTAVGKELRELVLSTSKDLQSENWTHYHNNPILVRRTPAGFDGKIKDCMLYKEDGQWIMYYSVVMERTNDKDHWVVGYSTSKDLLTWSETKVAFDQNTDPGVESPFVVKRGKYYYLFLSGRPWPIGGVDVFRSESPFHWDEKHDYIKRFPKNPTKAHAMEIIQDHNGQWYMTRCGKDIGGWWIAPLTWNDGQ